LHHHRAAAPHHCSHVGALVLLFLNMLTLTEAVDYIAQSYATLALFFGVMVMVRAFEPTGIFEYLATQMVVLAGGQGKRLLLGIVAITTPISAVLPNATTVMLLAPLIPRHWFVKVGELKASGIKDFMHADRARDEPHRHGWRHFAP
jgi:Na+/H+ antiporter NhaD/arsenite permease-like protein